jgi:hypothetical protein
MNTLSIVVSALAFSISALTFLYSRHESRRRKKWLLFRLRHFQYDLKEYGENLKDIIRRNKFPCGVMFHSLAWDEMKLEPEDVELLSEYDDMKLLEKKEASLGYIRGALEYWYRQPKMMTPKGGEVQIENIADAQLRLNIVVVNVRMVNKAILEMEKWYRKIY